MTIITLCALLLGRRGDVFNSMSIAALILLAFRPHALFDVGFHLSYGATIAIIIFARPFSNIRNYAFNSFIVSLAAFLGTAYATAYHFGFVNVIGIFTSVVIMPIVGFALCAGYIMALAAPYLDGIAYNIYPLMRLMRLGIGDFAQMPGIINVPRPGAGTFVIYLAILFVLYSIFGEYYDKKKQIAH